VTEGTSYINEGTNYSWVTWANETLASGKLLGLYHYADGGDATAEADYFISAIKDYIGKAILLVDWEASGNSTFNSGNDATWVATFRSRVLACTNVNPLVYASLSTFQSQLSGVADDERWVAQYANNNEVDGYEDSPWNEGAYDCTLRQYTSNGYITGYNSNLDLDKFYGTASDWEQLECPTYYNGINYSTVYDYSYYVNAYADLWAAYGVNDDEYGAFQHFITYGMSEHRQAISTFNPTSYRLEYRDLRIAFGNDWESYYLHYIQFGQYEGRITTGVTTLQNAVTTYNGINYSTVYNYAYYYAKYADLQAAFGAYDDDKMLQHFVTYGMSEGRQACDTFNVYVYKANNPDLQATFGNNLKAYYLHYINDGSSTPVYRLYNPNSGEHFYTTSTSEKNHLVSLGWSYEGIAWYSVPSSSGTSVYRLYNPNSGEHFYTTSTSEKNHLVSLGWSYEGVAWYGIG
jgi:hypothetical protein